MSLAAACAASLLRSVILGVLAYPVCSLLANHLKSCTPRGRWLLAATLLVPFLVPELLIGYAYAGILGAGVPSSELREFVVSLLIVLRLIPAGTLVAYCAPPAPLSPSARHCHQLALQANRTLLDRLIAGLRFWLYGPIYSGMPIVCLVFLLAFQEFELPSLLNATTWTVWLFDAQAGGLPLADSLRYVTWPLLAEGIVLVPVVLFVHRTVCTDHTGRDQSGSRAPWCVGIYLCVALFFYGAIPAWVLGRDTWTGLAALLAQPSQLAHFCSEIGNAAAFGGLAGAIAAGLTNVLWRPPRSPWAGVLSRMALILAAIPGCGGELVLGLLIQFLFQQPGLSPFYDTPLPLTLALTLHLLPRALLLQLLFGSLTPGTAVHCATLLSGAADAKLNASGRRLIWRLSGHGRFWSAILVCYWGYLELTLPSILYPTRSVTAPVRLYNLMHYGRVPTLSAMSFLAAAFPASCVLLCWGVMAAWQTRSRRSASVALSRDGG